MNAELLFWLAVGWVVYVYLGFPVLLWALAWIFPKPVARRPVTPSVSLLVAAYNEERVIAAKVANSLALDYPRDLLEIVIVSDGSTDRTAALAGELAQDRVRVIAHTGNRGKLTVLNEAVPLLRGEIVAFSDAASMLAPDAIRALVANFADPRVGAVSAIYRVGALDTADIGASEAFYWKYESFLKLRQSTLGSVLGAHGSLYAIRKALYPFPAPGTINDDYVIPMRILQQGYRVIYEPAAVSAEESAEMSGFSRRVRIMAGNVEQLREMVPLLSPPRPLPLFFFVSYKLGRLLVPFCMVAALAAHAALLGSSGYRWLAVPHAGFYGLALWGAFRRLRPRLLQLPYYFCMINAAAFFGFYYATLGRGRLRWKRYAA
ncbi:MAG: glycosyltransferase family 2 protein [Bryobacterales bacterium]|nr:glycosyltransferase family 2 protein [Bryobacterales bacterium]